MKVTAFTNKGGVREHNEDAIAFPDCIMTGISMSSPVEAEVESTGRCFAVIDGMGGYEGGEMAARLVALSFIRNMPAYKVSVQDAKDRITHILTVAGQLISQTVQKDITLASMGAVIAGIVICSDAVLVFNCGDCRVYRQQGEYLEKLSHDHSIVQELYDRGEIEEDDMRIHPKKNVITACVSSKAEDFKLFFRVLPLNSEPQRFLICSDGVWEAIRINDLERCITRPKTLESAQRLAEVLLGFHEDCADNISFMIIES